MIYKKFLLVTLGVVYLFFTLFFSIGFVFSMMNLPADVPDPVVYYYFAFGFCAVPSWLFVGGALEFYPLLIKKLKSVE